MGEKEEKIDYLEVDDELSHQRFVCLSIVSPESLIEKREVFNVCKFLQSYCKEQKLEYKDVYSKYDDFTYKFSSELQRDFDEQNKFQTSNPPSGVNRSRLDCNVVLTKSTISRNLVLYT